MPPRRQPPIEVHAPEIWELAQGDPHALTAQVHDLESAAERGDTAAQLTLGRIFARGLPGIPRDTARAHQWLQRAESTHPGSAAHDLGLLQQQSTDIPADPATAARWFEIAAQGGSPDAMFMLANAARTGTGVPQDDARALRLYEHAAELEHAPALQALALAHLYGELGLTPDESEYRRYMAATEHALGHATHPRAPRSASYRADANPAPATITRP